MECCVEEEREGRSALHSCEREEDDRKRLAQNAFLPLDLVLRIITHLPSRVLFDFRRLCKAAHSRALLSLAHRPFLVLQNDPPSPLCYLLPLDSPCSPLPSSFTIAKPSFRLLSASRNLLCFHRQYALLLDICVCNIFQKWKTVLPPIVQPSFAPHISRQVFLEDINVSSLRVVGFHATLPTINTHKEEVSSPGYRIFVASPTYLRIFDSHLNQWSGPVYFPTHLCKGRHNPPVGFATSDGNLILTFYYKVITVFNYQDQSFHAMELGFRPEFEVAGYPASAKVDCSFNLEVRLPHVEECVRSSCNGGLVLRGLCKNDFDSPPYGCFRICMDGACHDHQYSRHLLHSFCHAYQGKVYALVMERDEMRCFTEDRRDYPPDFIDDRELVPPGWDLPLLRERQQQHDRPLSSNKCEGKQWHDLPSVDVEKSLYPDKDTTFDCAQFFPACSPRKLTLYSACIDTTNWTMKVSKEADATACLDVFDSKGATFSFISG